MLFRKRHDPAESRPEAPGGTSVGAVIGAAVGGGTVIGAHTRIRGALKGSGGIVVRGAIAGEIAILGGLTIAPTGRVEAEVEAQSVELSGEARGTIRASGRVALAATGVFEGDISTPILEVQPGSIVHGRARVAGIPAPGRDDLSH